MFQKKLTLIKQVHQKSVRFVIIDTLKYKYTNCGYKFEPHVFNKSHDVLMTANELKNIATLTGKGADGRFISWGISKNEAVNISNNSLLEDKAVL